MDGPCLRCHSLHVIQLGYSGYCLLCGLTCLTACVAFRCGNYEITQNIKRSVVTLKNIFSFKAEQSHFHSYHQFMILTVAGSSCYVQLRTNVNREKHYFINLIAPLYQNLS